MNGPGKAIIRIEAQGNIDGSSLQTCAAISDWELQPFLYTSTAAMVAHSDMEVASHLAQLFTYLWRRHTSHVLSGKGLKL